MPDRVTLHGSAVAIADLAVLILGASGTGKSTLALELIALGSALVADDRVEARSTADGIVLGAPTALHGLIEARGIGLMRLPVAGHAILRLIVDLDAPPAPRLPPRENRDLLGRAVPVINGPVRPGLASAIVVLLGGGELVDPDAAVRD